MEKEVEHQPALPMFNRAVKVEEVLDHGLVGSIAYQGGVVTGFSMKVGEDDFLVTLRAEFPAGHRIAWVGGINMTEVILKAERQAAAGELTWREDRYKPD